MSQSRVAGRYAQALVDEARQATALDTVATSLSSLADALRASKDLALLFQSPIIAVGKKQEALKAVFAELAIDAVTSRFVAFLVEKRRENDINAILSAFDKLYCDLTGKVRVHVRTAAPVSAEERSAIENKLRIKTGKQPLAEYAVDEALIGGFVATIGDTSIDCSARYQLQRLSKSLTLGV